MRRRAIPLQLAFIALAACPLAAGCVGAAIEPVPVSAARLDAEAALSIELAYKAAGRALIIARTGNTFPSRGWPKVQRLDRVAFGAVREVRQAYASGDAGRYTVTVRDARAAIKQLAEVQYEPGLVDCTARY